MEITALQRTSTAAFVALAQCSRSPSAKTLNYCLDLGSNLLLVLEYERFGKEVNLGASMSGG